MIEELSNFLILSAMVLLAAANFTSMRLNSAPPIGSGPRCWPWQLQDRYTRRGFVVNSVGLVFWILGVLLSTVQLFQ